MDSILGARKLLKILRYLGLWHWSVAKESTSSSSSSHKFIPPNVFCALLHFPFTFLFTLQMWIQAFVAENLEQAGDVVYLSSTETTLVVKVLNIWIVGSRAYQFIDELANERKYKLRSQAEIDLWRRIQEPFESVALAYIGCSLAAMTWPVVSVLFVKDYQLPFPCWLPFDYTLSSTRFWFIYIYDVFAVAFTCLANTTLDMINNYFMLHLALLYQLLALRLQELSGLPEHEAVPKLIEIFQLHQNIRRLKLECEKLVSAPIFIQVLLSASSLCFSSYRLTYNSVTENPGEVFAVCQFLSVMVLQIFLPCYYASEVTINANRLIQNVYNCDWSDYSVKSQKLINLYMELLKEPIVIRAGNFLHVGLPTFSKTINNAYSLFAVLMNMNK